ncbi:hypothetical protein PR001_g16892 [Phytophthora rubi]|uniref:Reverse transcriptase domain-containing protein n=1 Tax=Phytophthora rubi TaxID=129364 RepID=A0A6A3KQQ4_9STRA|nr:hypothetical protein PR001_g16892 [Phytophthora rubi]
MLESDIPLMAVSTPNGMVWEWLVMPQGLKNAPATFNSRAVNGKSKVEIHKEHLRKLFALMRKHKLYANLKRCIFGASEISALGCLVGKNDVRPDSGKVRVINEWPTPSNTKELRQFLGLATYLHHWSDCLPMAEFAISNSVHVSTGHTLFYVNAMRHPRVPSVSAFTRVFALASGLNLNEKKTLVVVLNPVEATKSRYLLAPLKVQGPLILSRYLANPVGSTPAEEYT